MDPNFHRNLIFDAVEDISQVTALADVVATLTGAIEEFGFRFFGISGLPQPANRADPVVLAERIPKDFRDCYTEERFYLVDHIGAHARATCRPFRYSEAPYDGARAQKHERFLQALGTYGLGKGLIVPIGRPTGIPACVWLAGENPDLNDDAIRAVQLIALVAAGKAHALTYPKDDTPARRLTLREREVLQWISAGKTSWEIAAISGLSERAVNKIAGEAMTKLDAVTRAQAVANAIRVGEIAL